MWLIRSKVRPIDSHWSYEVIPEKFCRCFQKVGLDSPTPAWYVRYDLDYALCSQPTCGKEKASKNREERLTSSTLTSSQGHHQLTPCALPDLVNHRVSRWSFKPLGQGLKETLGDVTIRLPNGVTCALPDLVSPWPGQPPIVLLFIQPLEVVPTVRPRGRPVLASGSL